MDVFKERISRLRIKFIGIIRFDYHDFCQLFGNQLSKIGKETLFYILINISFIFLISYILSIII